MQLLEPITYGKERTKCTDTHLNCNELVNVRRCIVESNHWTNAKKDIIKEQVVADIQQNENLTLLMNTVNNKTDNAAKH